MLKGVCWILLSMGGLARIGVDYVITMDSCTIVFVWLLTRLQGASTALAKRESIR
jgi:hypothetical protein